MIVKAEREHNECPSSVAVWTALHLACANGHLAVVALLLERRCQLNLRDSENRTALMKAVECQEEKCATLLLEHGADPNLTDANGNTALHHAVFCQNISLAAKLPSYDANIEARNEDDLTPLLLAISERKQQMVEFLVKKEANVHAVDKMKRTALILAVSYESMGVVSLLLQRGADVSSQDVFGRTAEEYAALSGFNTICQLISEYKEKRPKTPPEKSNPGCRHVNVTAPALQARGCSAPLPVESLHVSHPSSIRS
ncbi:putative ankyrin repeat domain-containing protein 19 [Cervus canadensis]|uniref:putative ankyrin repeat domain-containing protein 19 n=1 Tax=Cervus canadensis TaxID=1574408 RepID=UPI001CA31211|nr:putative ankyrin repeat domain-containing protein 19 [Cervus canadensis]